MGCDIHAYLEESIDGTWLDLGEIRDTNRDYHLFGILAGVRTPCHPIQPRRGLPYDVSDGISTIHKQWGSDAHSASWYMINELIEFKGPVTEDSNSRLLTAPWASIRPGYVAAASDQIMESLQSFIEVIKKEIKVGDMSKFRVIFWFDN